MNKKDFLSAFFQTMNEEGVDYFVYGSYLALPEDTGGSDIDMVVEENDFPKVSRILDSLTRNNRVSKVSYYANANAKFYRLLFFPKSFGIQLDIFYKGLCYQGIEYYPMKLMRERVIEYNGIKVLDIKKGYYMIDYTFGYFKKVWPQIHTKSKVFIFDRYYYEYYLDQKRSRTNLPQWIIRFGELFLPNPDLILCLGGDPVKIYDRKPEKSLDEVKRQTEAFKKFCREMKNAVLIDTMVLPEESVKAALGACYEVMSKRFNKIES